MKRKLILMIFPFLLLASLSACQREAEANKPVIEMTNPPRSTDAPMTTDQPATGQATGEPTATITPAAPSEPEDTGVSASVTNPVLMPVPPFSYYISDAAKADAASQAETSAFKLTMTFNEPNKITDTDKWFTNNQLSLNPTGETSPDEIASFTTAYGDGTYFYQIEGIDYSGGIFLNIYATGSDKLLYSLDFSNYLYSPEYKEEDYNFIQQKIQCAAVQDNILYVSHSHSTYAESSNNMNAYITAIDLSDMGILWRSDALVCNSMSFVIVNDVIICGYGFTAEPDFLYQIDCNTGKVLEKTPLKSAPEYIIKKDSTLFVRTYNTDYQFVIQ